MGRPKFVTTNCTCLPNFMDFIFNIHSSFVNLLTTAQNLCHFPSKHCPTTASELLLYSLINITALLMKIQRTKTNKYYTEEDICCVDLDLLEKRIYDNDLSVAHNFRVAENRLNFSLAQRYLSELSLEK